MRRTECERLANCGIRRCWDFMDGIGDCAKWILNITNEVRIINLQERASIISNSQLMFITKRDIELEKREEERHLF